MTRELAWERYRYGYSNLHLNQCVLDLAFRIPLKINYVLCILYSMVLFLLFAMNFSFPLILISFLLLLSVAIEVNSCNRLSHIDRFISEIISEERVKQFSTAS